LQNIHYKRDSSGSGPGSLRALFIVSFSIAGEVELVGQVIVVVWPGDLIFRRLTAGLIEHPQLRVVAEDAQVFVRSR
jgi:hypothetical protein